MSRRRTEREGGDLSRPVRSSTSDRTDGSASAGTCNRPFPSLIAPTRIASASSSSEMSSAWPVGGGDARALAAALASAPPASAVASGPARGVDGPERGVDGTLATALAEGGVEHGGSAGPEEEGSGGVPGTEGARLGRLANETLMTQSEICTRRCASWEGAFRPVMASMRWHTAARCSDGGSPSCSSSSACSSVGSSMCTDCQREAAFSASGSAGGRGGGGAKTSTASRTTAGALAIGALGSLLEVAAALAPTDGGSESGPHASERNASAKAWDAGVEGCMWRCSSGGDRPSRSWSTSSFSCSAATSSAETSEVIVLNGAPAHQSAKKGSQSVNQIISVKCRCP